MRVALIATVASALISGLPATTQAQSTVPDFHDLEQVAREELEATGTPGAAVAVILGDRVVFAKGFGVGSVESREPVTSDTLFRIASTTKMLTAAALASLEEQGRVRFDVPIARYAKGLDTKIGRLTLHQLLSHTAGLRDESSYSGPNDDEALGAYVRSWKSEYLFTEPGVIYSYSNPGYALAGFILGEAAGKPYAEAMDDLLFEPLGMRRSAVRPTLAMTYPIAQAHDPTATGPRVVRPYPDDARFRPNGGVFTSVNDFSRFALAFLNGGKVDGRQALPRAVIARLSELHFPRPGGAAEDEAHVAYGLVERQHRGVLVFQHGGSRLGSGSVVRMAPEHHFAVIILSNRTGSYLPKTLEKATELCLPLRREAGPDRKAPRPLTREEKESLVGRYVNHPDELSVEIFMDGDALMIRRPGEKTAAPLVQTGERQFSFGGQELTVIRGPEGTPTYVHVGGRALKRSDRLRGSWRSSTDLGSARGSSTCRC
jgi:CubicO group peptidase (beta-lactamase class C family)